ncbi:MAG: SBBP repeat-containing protein [Chloroflexi bacterium]|nr:SBBP repeat-containing protein [Chloroflexota bacterium]
MVTRKSISRIFSILLIALFLQIGAQPVQADPLYAEGDFLWAKSMGGADWDQASDLAVDSNGNVYTTGNFRGTSDFDPGVGITNLTSTGVQDIFISKLDSNGNFLWVKSMGGNGIENWGTGLAIAIDASGNIYMTGTFHGTIDFDPGVEVFNLIGIGKSDFIFVSKLDSTGNFIWAKSIGSSSAFTYVRDIAIDSSGFVYTTGIFGDIVPLDFDPGVGIFNLLAEGYYQYDIFISKLDRNGDFIWAKRIGGQYNEEVNNIALDSTGNVYTTGFYQKGADFDPGPEIFNLTDPGDFYYGVFVSKLDLNGNFVWAKIPSGSGGRITVDLIGNIYMTGYFSGTVDFDPDLGISELTSAGPSDIFISKFDTNGNFIFAKSMGGDLYDSGYGIIVDPSEDIFTFGYFQGTADFDPGPGLFNLISEGDTDNFISKLDRSGNFVWANRLGGISNFPFNINKLIQDSNGNVYTTGDFWETIDFDPSPGISELTSSGYSDIFVSKYYNDSSPTVSSLIRANTSPTSASTVDFTVTFSEPVTGVDMIGPAFDDFTLSTSSGIVGASVTSVSGSGKTYTVTANTGSGNGTIRLNVMVDGNIVDTTLNPFAISFNAGEIYSVIKIATFADVPLFYWSNGSIERLYNAGITGGCSTSPLNYCPNAPVTRAQLAIFLVRAMHGVAYIPPSAFGIFTDVPVGSFGADYIEQLYWDGITNGCGIDKYCPAATVTRAQAAIFLVRAMHSSTFVPPPATGNFTDVSIGSFGANYIEHLFADGITSGCGAGIYCPNNPVTRAQMAVFLVKTFNLP